MHGLASPHQSAGPQPTAPSAYANASALPSTTVAVVGAGVLGRCIAIDLSLLGVHVLVCDPKAQSTDGLSAFAYELLHPLLYLGYVTKSMVTQACRHVTVVANVAECAAASLIIEAIPEDVKAKVELFKALEQHCAASAILASSTINLSIDALQLQLQHPERFLGVRFFYPCVLVSPVELTTGTATSQHTIDRVVTFLQRLEKYPHRGPTKRVLSTDEVSSFQFDTAVRGSFYHGLLAPKRQAAVADIITPTPGPPLCGHCATGSDTTAL